jgi:hypothetical protein
MTAVGAKRTLNTKRSCPRDNTAHKKAEAKYTLAIVQKDHVPAKERIELQR